VFRGLAGLNAAAGQVPAFGVAMTNQQNAAFFVGADRAHAERHASANPPPRPQDRRYDRAEAKPPFTHFEESANFIPK
jgi:hypothetical protein